MLRQSPSRSNRSKKLRPSHTLEAFLLVAVGVWIVYQVTRSYGKQRVVAVETGGGGGGDGQPARRWLGRKGFVGFAASGQASADDIDGARDDWSAAGSSDDPLSRAGDAGDEEDQEEPGEDDGVDSDADDVAGGLAADEEDDDTDFLSQSGSSEDELKAAQGQAQNRVNMTVVPPVNATDTVQDGGAVLPANGTGGAADSTALTSSGYPLKNNSSSAHLPWRDRGAAGDVANKHGRTVGLNQSLEIKNETADSLAGHGISSRRW